MRCVGTGCHRLAFRLPGDVPLCLDHLHAVRDALGVPESPDAPTVAGSVVYYIGHSKKPFVKIGVSQNVHKRLRALSTMTQPVHLLAVEPGGYYLERKRHGQFRQLRQPGTEWFRQTDWLMNHIHELVDQHGKPRCNCPANSGRACIV